MLRILQKLILTVSLLAVIATPSHAMFIQPDWWDPSDPRVGTNRYSYSHNDPINLADPNGNVPYNPGGSNSTGWTDNDDGTSTYDSRTDHDSADYLQDDGIHTIGRYDSETFSEDAITGGRSRTRSGVNSSFYDTDSGYRRAEDDAVAISGNRNMEKARNAAGVVIGAGSLASGMGEAVTLGRGLLSAKGFFTGFRAVSSAEAADIVENGFRAGPNSSAGKWFAESAEQAGEFLADPRFGASKVVPGRVPREVYERSYKVPNLDNRGPSFYVSPEDLQFIK